MKKLVLASAIASTALFASVGYAELKDLSNDQLSQIHGEDGLSLRLDLGLGSDPLEEDLAYDAIGNGFDAGTTRPKDLGIAIGSTTSADNSRRLAIRLPKTGDEPPFSLMLDNLRLAVSLEQVDINLEDITDGIRTANAIQISFPGVVDIKRLSVDGLYNLPEVGSTVTERNPDGSTTDYVIQAGQGLEADGSNLGALDVETAFCADASDPDCGFVNILGIDVDMTLKIDGAINLFPAGPTADLATPVGDSSAINSSASTFNGVLYRDNDPASATYLQTSPTPVAGYDLYRQNLPEPSFNAGQGYIR
ncbi:MAG: hypothetical protein SVC26_06385 [Pseudomonadota bacterium]|nr:hypothetical protein [Pseudomonadota bacterium]